MVLRIAQTAGFSNHEKIVLVFSLYVAAAPPKGSKNPQSSLSKYMCFSFDILCYVAAALLEGSEMHIRHSLITFVSRLNERPVAAAPPEASQKAPSALRIPTFLMESGDGTLVRCNSKLITKLHSKQPYVS